MNQLANTESAEFLDEDNFRGYIYTDWAPVAIPKHDEPIEHQIKMHVAKIPQTENGQAGEASQAEGDNNAVHCKTSA